MAATLVVEVEEYTRLLAEFTEGTQVSTHLAHQVMGNASVCPNSIVTEDLGQDLAVFMEETVEVGMTKEMVGTTLILA